MPIVKCRKCDDEFYTKPSHIKRGDGKYCSIKCRALDQLRGKYVNCNICSKRVWKRPKALEHSKSGKFFCNKSCQTIWRNSIMFIGPKHPNWKGGGSTYRHILTKSDLPKKCKRCETNDMRILAVHHIDKNRKNNNIINLTWLCHNCHFLIHNDKVETEKFMGTMVK